MMVDDCHPNDGEDEAMMVMVVSSPHPYYNEGSGSDMNVDLCADNPERHPDDKDDADAANNDNDDDDVMLIFI